MGQTDFSKTTFMTFMTIMTIMTSVTQISFLLNGGKVTGREGQTREPVKLWKTGYYPEIDCVVDAAGLSFKKQFAKKPFRFVREN
jgi:hypothetical protein